MVSALKDIFRCIFLRKSNFLYFLFLSYSRIFFLSSLPRENPFNFLCFLFRHSGSDLSYLISISSNFFDSILFLWLLINDFALNSARSRFDHFPLNSRFRVLFFVQCSSNFMCDSQFMFNSIFNFVFSQFSFDFRLLRPHRVFLCSFYFVLVVLVQFHA